MEGAESTISPLSCMHGPCRVASENVQGQRLAVIANFSIFCMLSSGDGSYLASVGSVTSSRVEFVPGPFFTVLMARMSNQYSYTMRKASGYDVHGEAIHVGCYVFECLQQRHYSKSSKCISKQIGLCKGQLLIQGLQRLSGSTLSAYLLLV